MEEVETNIIKNSFFVWLVGYLIGYHNFWRKKIKALQQKVKGEQMSKMRNIVICCNEKKITNLFNKHRI